MKNLKVSAKLIVGFMIAIAFTAAVGIVGIVGMLNINTGASDMYDYNTVPLPYMARVIEDLQRIRVNVRQYVVNCVEFDGDERTAAVEETRAAIMEYIGNITANLDAFEETIKSPDVQNIFDTTRPLLTGEYAPHLNRCYEYALEDDYMSIIAELEDAQALTNFIVDNFVECMNMKVDDAAKANDAGNTLFSTMLVVIIVVLVIAIAVSMFLALYISSLIAKPLALLRTYLDDAGSKGKLEMTPEEERLIPEYSRNKDEIGDTFKSSTRFFNHILSISNTLEKIASGDLTVDVEVLSEEDTMGTSMRTMVNKLNDMFGEINASTNQVSVGAKQIADGSQTLAQGSTEQAASVQQLSSSIAEVAEKTKKNAEMAGQAAILAGTIKDNAEKGSRQMDEMVTAVGEINEASKSISKVIKTIDDIAFQTNILALNAAVEAARAGQHGKGFAVVAEEVRSLAAKSADAAKETGEMIQNSMDKAELGSRIANETAGSLTEIVSGINESSELIGDIAQSSDEQSAGIEQINKGIDQVAQVVQQNSATAEESAAAAEQMSGQSDMLQDLVEQFKLKNSNNSFRSLPNVPRNAAAGSPAPVTADTDFSDNNESFGKY